MLSYSLQMIVCPRTLGTSEATSSMAASRRTDYSSLRPDITQAVGDPGNTSRDLEASVKLKPGDRTTPGEVIL